MGMGLYGPRLGLSQPVVAAAPAGDALDTALAALEAAGKLVAAWFLPSADPDQYLTLSGADVTAWAAAYGSQKVTLDGTGHAPQWDATLFSNKGGLTFNGTSQYVEGGGNVSNWPDASSDLWMLAAVRQDVAAGSAGIRRAIAYGEAGTTARMVGRTVLSSVNRVSAIAGSSALTGGTADLSGAHTVGVNFDIGGTSTGYVDGTSDGTVATASATLTLTRVRIGASALVTPSQFWSGAIVMAAVLNSTASGTDFTNLEALARARLS